MRETIQPAPEARQKVARGKRVARSPWITFITHRALKGRKELRKTESLEMLQTQAQLNTKSANVC